ncbi:MAG: hypothetical protein P8O70_09540 [SAR324 cluster bacterium]|nr:hypothetical protein [SAR324 cluster bacterium]
MSKLPIVGKAFLCGVLAHGRNHDSIACRDTFQGQWFGRGSMRFPE